MSRRLCILLVEDNEDILFIMKAELEWVGYWVEAATDGERALEIAMAQPLDLIISDVQMPGIGGLEFMRRVRGIPALASVPSIAMTGFSSPDNIQRILAHGFTTHVVKPVDPDDLIALIQELTATRRLTKAS